MNTALRVLAAALLALWLAIPGVSGDEAGGENAGGTGVWILPRCEMLSSGSAQNAAFGSPRVAAFVVTDLSKDVRMCVSGECGQTVASLFAGVSGSPISLPVIGQYLLLPSSVMQGLLNARVEVSDIVVLDASQKGYRMQFRIDLQTGQAQILVF
jgi:hypothetical protein